MTVRTSILLLLLCVLLPSPAFALEVFSNLPPVPSDLHGSALATGVEGFDRRDLATPFSVPGYSRLDQVQIDVLSGADGWLPGFDLSLAQGAEAPEYVLESNAHPAQFVGGSSEPFRLSVAFSGETILEAPPFEDDLLPLEMKYWIVLEPLEGEEVHWLEVSTPGSASAAVSVNEGVWTSLDPDRALTIAVRATPLSSRILRVKAAGDAEALIFLNPSQQDESSLPGEYRSTAPLDARLTYRFAQVSIPPGPIVIVRQYMEIELVSSSASSGEWFAQTPLIDAVFSGHVTSFHLRLAGQGLEGDQILPAFDPFEEGELELTYGTEVGLLSVREVEVMKMPEPAAAGLGGSALLALAFLRRLRSRRVRARHSRSS